MGRYAPDWAEKQAQRDAVNSAAELKKQEAVRLGRVKQAMQMKYDGFDWPEIAETVGYPTAAAAASDVHMALEEEFLNNEQYSSEILRMIELKRLNTLYNALLPGIQRGNSRAVDVAVKISDRISKMTGLDAAVKVEMATLSDVNGQIEQLKREIAERQKARAEIEAPVYDAELEE